MKHWSVKTPVWLVSEQEANETEGIREGGKLLKMTHLTNSDMNTLSE